jgi:hypothetical protein
MKTLNNINLADAFRFASNISGRLPQDMTLGDVADTFNDIAAMVNGALLRSPKVEAVAAAPAAPAKKRGRPAGTGKKAVTEKPAKAPKAPKAAKPAKAPATNKSGGERAPRGQRKQIVKEVVTAAGGTMAFAAAAKAVIEREGAEGDAAKILHNSVYALLNKMIEQGEATLASDDPKTIRIKADSSKSKSKSDDIEIETDA